METQLEGWKTTAKEIVNSYQEILGTESGKKLDACNFATRTVGANSDHSEDQKKLWQLFRKWKDDCTNEKRGEHIILNMVPTNLLPLLISLTDKTVDKAGGWHAWERLTAEEQTWRHEEALANLYQTFSEQAFGKMMDCKKQAAQLFLCVGCSMHKDMNAVKGVQRRCRSGGYKMYLKRTGR